MRRCLGVYSSLFIIGAWKLRVIDNGSGRDHDFPTLIGEFHHVALCKTRPLTYVGRDCYLAVTLNFRRRTHRGAVLVQDVGIPDSDKESIATNTTDQRAS